MAKPNSSGSRVNQDGQNFEIDINQIYKDWITPIDNIRSLANLNNNRNFLDSIKTYPDIISYSKQIKMEKVPQESRCHAFFRLLGLPIVAKDNTFFNSGFDITPDILSNGDSVLNIAQNPIQDFNALSEARENYVQTNLSIFTNPTSIDAGVLALSSGGSSELRQFIVPLDKDSSPFGGLDPSNQSYPVNRDSLVGTRGVDLDQYQDANGITPLPSTLADRFHIVKPFIVDARINFTVSPQSKLIAVPFVADNSFTQVSPTTNVPRPLIEKIIRDRLAISQESPSSNVTSIQDFVKNNPVIQDSELVSIIQTNPYNQSDQDKFIDNINTIITMMSELFDSQNIIDVAQGRYYWVPAPDVTGPEGGSTVQGVFLPSVIDSRLVTNLDKEIIISIAKSVTNNLNSDSAQSTAANDPLNFTNKTTFGPDTSSGLGDNNAKNMETLSQTRKRVLSKANTALQTIEIIMGEFSGFGLCDIVAIIGALNIMPIESLVGLLDEAAFNRMLELPFTNNVSQNDFTKSMTDFTNMVKDFYNLMDKIYQDISTKGGYVAS